MKKNYIIILSLLFGIFAGIESQAQKRLLFRIQDIRTTISTDCDGLVAGSSDWEFQFSTSGGDPCFERDVDNATGWHTVNNYLQDRYYYSRECWPTGNFNISMRGLEDDGLSNCDNDCGEGMSSWNRSIRAWNSAAGNFLDWNDLNRSSTCGCTGEGAGGSNVNQNYRFRGTQYVSPGGSSAYTCGNLDGNKYVTNQSACTAIDIDGGSQATGTRVSNHAIQCRNTWYQYDLVSNESYLDFDPSNNSVYVNVYYSASNSCGSYCHVGGGSGYYRVRDPQPGRYFIQLSATGLYGSGQGNTNMNVARGGTASNDFIWNATNMGTANPGTTLQLNSENNVGSSAESGEPYQNCCDSDNETDWYRFTTGATVPAQLHIETEHNGGDEIDLDFVLLRLNDNSYNFSRCGVDWSKLSYVGQGDGGDNTACIGSFNSYGDFCVSPNTTYYIQVRGYYNGGLCGDQDDGTFRVEVSSTSTASGPDAICSPHNFGTISSSYTSPYVYYNNRCLGTSAGEPRTGDMSNTMWYKFRTPPEGLLEVTVNVEESGEGANYVAVALHQDANTTCGYSGMTERGFERWCASSGGDLTYDCLPGNTDFYIQVGTGYNFALCTNILNGGRSTGRYRVRLTSTSYSTGPDNFCDAGEMVLSGNGLLDMNESFSKNNQSNECASDETNEPETDGNDETVWYKFTTGATVGNNVNVHINRDADIDPYVAVYVACNGTGSCPSTNIANYGLDQVAFAGFPNPINIPTEDNPTASFVPYPNTTYYIQVDGYDCCNVVGGPEGRFDVSVSMSNTSPYAYDNFCGAYNLGGLSLGGTINSPTVNNFTSSAEELCALNEPNNDEDDETIWLKFTTSSLPGTEIEIDASANNDGSGGLDCIAGVSFAWVRVYEADGSPVLTCPFPNTSTNWFNGIVEADSDGGFLDASRRFLKCPKPNTTYYVQIENQGIGCDKSSFTVEITDNGYTSQSNDDLCDAHNMGTLTNQGTLLANNFSTFCSTKQAGEPNVDHGEPSADEEGSVWFRFTVAGTLGGNNSIGAMTEIYATEEGEVAITEQLYVRLYEATAGCSSMAGLSELDNKEDEAYYYNDILCIGQLIGDETPRTRIFGCLEPGKTYYVQVYVRESVAGISTDLGLTDERGHFDLHIENSRPIPNDNDNFVDATAITGLGDATYPSNRTYPNSTDLINENNLCAGVEPFENSVATILELDHTVWYRFIAPASGSVQFEVINTSANNDPEEDIEEQISVYEYTGGAVPTAGDFELLMEYDADDDGPFGEDGEITWDDQVFVACLEPGDVYYIRIDGAYDNLTGYCPGDAMRGDFDLKLRDYDIWENNDRVCDAIDIMSYTDNLTLTASEMTTWRECGTEVTIELNYQSNYCANNVNEIINPWTDGTNQTVWYAFEAPATGMITIEAENTYSCNILNPAKRALIDLRLAVYDLNTGFACGDMAANPASFTLMGSAESTGILDINCVGINEKLEIDCLEPNRIYYLVVDGKDRLGNPNGEFGEFELDLTNTIKDFFNNNVRDLYEPAPNNDICDAIALGNPTGGGVDTDVNSLVYPSPARDCRNSENTYCADDAGDPAINGFSLWGTDNSVWYTFVAPSTGAVEIEVDGDVHGNSDQLSPQIAVFETSNQVTPCAGDLFDVFVGPAISTGFTTNYNSGVINCLEPGNIYFLMVDGGPYAFDLFDLDGTFEVTITEETPTEFPPANDDLCNAISINPFTSVGAGGAPVSLDDQTNRCSSREFHIPEPGTFTRDRTVWYTFTTPANPAGSNGNGTYAVDISVLSDLPWPFGDAMDPQIALYESSDNTCSGTITEKYSNYDILNIPFTESVNIQCLDPATQYWIMVDGSGLNPQGFFDIDVDEDLAPVPIAVNDMICSNVNLGTLGPVNGNTLGGTTPLYNNFCTSTEPGEPNPQWLLVNNIDHTVWFQFTTPNVAQNVNVDVELYSDNSDNVDLMMALYLSSDNTCTGTMTEIKSEYDPTILFCLDGLCDETLNDLCLAPNTTYFLQVDGSFLNRQGYFGVEIINDGLVVGPPNDDFCNATAMTFNAGGLARLTNETNECATVELNEPFTDHPIVVSAKRTVWYSFVAPPSGRVTITTEDNDGSISGIDPHWALYQYDGACVGGAIPDINDFDQLENAYFPTVAVTNPDDDDVHLCLFPGDTYYIQVDGSFLGREGFFNVEVQDMYPNYSTSPEPSNNDCSLAATSLTVQEKSCQFDDGGWFTFDYGEATRSFRDEAPGCGNNCGDTWYTFDMPPLDPSCPGNVSFVKIEGRDASGLFGVSESDLTVVAWTGPDCNSLTYMDCSVSSQEDIDEADFSLAAAPGTQVWLQIYSNKGNDYDNEDFDICVSRRYSADDCLDALADTMEYEVEYCWDIRDATGEDISAGDDGYELGGIVNENTDNSAYFQFLTDDFCWGYEIIVRIDDPAGLSEGGDCNFPGTLAENPSGTMQIAVFQDATPCDGGYDARLDFQEINDCQSQYLSTVEWRQTYYVDREAPVDGDSIAPNSRFIIQLESLNRDIMDGTIEIHKICEGREWAYVNTLGTTSSTGYCLDGTLRHYYNDAGTPGNPADDILMFTVEPNGNTFDGTAHVTLLADDTEATTPGVEGSWAMRRYWNFDVTSGSIDPNFPVEARFYYQDAEKNEIIAEAQAFATLYGLQYEPFEWFKSYNGFDYIPGSHVTPPQVIADWSETGQFTGNVFGVNGGDYAQDHDEDPTNEWCNGVQYVQMVGLTGFSGGTGAAGASETNQSPLPVELISFVGWNEGDVNQLEWVTATEINNDVFVVERSADAINFVEIGTVPGSGNTTEEVTYNLTDFTPIQGVNYYRLKQIDFDGSFVYSAIIVIEVQSAIAKTAIVKLHPNPANDIINIQLQSATNTTFNMAIVDVTGRLVEFKEVNASAGLNAPFALEIQDYPQGVYMINLVDQQTGETLEAKFVKQ